MLNSMKLPDSATPDELEDVARRMREISVTEGDRTFAAQLNITAGVIDRFVATIREQVKSVEEAIEALQAVWPDDQPPITTKKETLQ